jgi:hypothetical protein
VKKVFKKNIYIICTTLQNSTVRNNFLNSSSDYKSTVKNVYPQCWFGGMQKIQFRHKTVMNCMVVNKDVVELELTQRNVFFLRIRIKDNGSPRDKKELNLWYMALKRKLPMQRRVAFS